MSSEVASPHEHAMALKDANSINDIGTPLHVAAIEDKSVHIYCMLDKEEFEVDVLRSDGKTALMLAVGHNCRKSVQVLLSYGANIDIVDNNGESALQMALRLSNIDFSIILNFIELLKEEAITNEELVERLFKAGCSVFHAIYVDAKVLKSLLERGSDVDSKRFRGKTALHVAAEENDLDVVKLLVEYGADVNALDDDRCSALCIAAAHGNPSIVKLLLKCGAEPNVKGFNCGLTPFILAMENFCKESARECDECVEILLLNGAVPSQKMDDYWTVLDEALRNDSQYRINLLISYVALSEMQGNIQLAETMMKCKLDENQSALPKLQEYYERCQQMLKMQVFGNVSLFDLLTASENKIRRYLRNKTICRNMPKVLGDLDRIYPYFYVLFNDRLNKIPGVLLENEAVSVISTVFDSSFNNCFVFAREIVEYLNQQDLNQLCKV